jgi:hypothetical protein
MNTWGSRLQIEAVDSAIPFACDNLVFSEM